MNFSSVYAFIRALLNIFHVPKSKMKKFLGACEGTERRGGPGEAKQGMEAGIYDIADA